MKDHEGWAHYVQTHLDSLGWTNSVLANAADIDRSLVGRWLDGSTQPTIESVRAVCRALHRDIREGLVAAGIFTEDEMKVSAPAAPDIRMISDEELLAEVGRRMARGRLRVAAAEVDVVDVGEQTGVDMGETEENPVPTRRRRRSPAGDAAAPSSR